MNLIDEARDRAAEVLRRNVTELGFTACVVDEAKDPHSNYNSVWARDASMTLVWSLPLRDAELIECGRRSLETILKYQIDDGHIPNYVTVSDERPEYGGVGGICGIDSALWLIIGMWNYVEASGDTAFIERHLDGLDKLMSWLRAHDSNNCGLLEIPEASDWTDLFPRSYNVLYDEVLWYRTNLAMAKLLHAVHRPNELYLNRASRIRKKINVEFWPTPDNKRADSFAETQYSLGRAHYLIAQIMPYGFSWRCDVLANTMAALYGVLNDQRSREAYQFLRQVGVDQPRPAKCLYPPIRPGEKEWRDYLLVNLQNLPHHYHNGGIWPFVGGLFVRFLLRLEERGHAERAIESLAELNHAGIEHAWEFTEWAHGETGRPMGKSQQAWSAASYIGAHACFSGDNRLESPSGEPEEEAAARRQGLDSGVLHGDDMDEHMARRRQERSAAERR